MTIGREMARLRRQHERELRSRDATADRMRARHEASDHPGWALCPCSDAAHLRRIAEIHHNEAMAAGMARP